MRRPAAHVRPVVVAGAEARVEPDRELAARKELAEGAELVDRAGVVEDAALDEALQVLRDLLGGDLDALRGDARCEGSLGLEAGACVDVEPTASKILRTERFGRAFIA